MVCERWGAHVVCLDCRRLWAVDTSRCPRCALPSPVPDEPCAECEAHSPEFDRAIAAVHYAAPWSTLIARLKYADACELAAPLGHMLAQAVVQRNQTTGASLPDVVVPMPLSRQRLRERGYNQSWLLAKACAGHLGRRTRHDVLARVSHTGPLMAMSRGAQPGVAGRV